MGPEPILLFFVTAENRCVPPARRSPFIRNAMESGFASFTFRQMTKLRSSMKH